MGSFLFTVSAREKMATNSKCTCGQGSSDFCNETAIATKHKMLFLFPFPPPSPQKSMLAMGLCMEPFRQVLRWRRQRLNLMPGNRHMQFWSRQSTAAWLRIKPCWSTEVQPNFWDPFGSFWTSWRLVACFPRQ